MRIDVSGIWDNIFKRRKEEVEKNVIDVIKNIPFFEDLSHRELRNVAQIAYVRHYEPSEDIINEGQASAAMYIIMNGEVEIFKQTKDGIKTVLTNIEENDANPIFGELGLIDDSPRTAAVTAVTSTALIVFFRSELLKLINEDPKTASKLIFKLARIIAERLRYTDERLQKAFEEIEQLQSMIPEKSDEDM